MDVKGSHLIELGFSPKIYIASIYLPCRGNHTIQAFVDILDEISEIIPKYSNLGALILCRDFNASLTRDPQNERDKLFKAFYKDNNLTTMQNGEPTFIHSNGEVKSEIDYILFNRTATQKILSTCVEQDHTANTSDNIAITSTLEFDACEKPQIQIYQSKRPAWNKCNKQIFREKVKFGLNTIQINCNQKLDDNISNFKQVLEQAASCSIPKRKFKNPGARTAVFNRETKDLSAKSKKAWWEWKKAKYPRNSQNKKTTEYDTCKTSLKKSSQTRGP